MKILSQSLTNVLNKEQKATLICLDQFVKAKLQNAFY